jgi:hypothetical protein
MPQVEVDGLTINYEVQGEGEPLLLIPYTSADHACYAFQLSAYSEHFSCIAIDLPGSGESDKPAGPYSTDGYADQVAAFLAPSGSSGRTWRACRSAGRWPPTWPPGIPAACARSRCTAVGTPAMTISEDRRRAVAHARVVATDRSRRGRPGHLPVVLHA